MSTAVTIRMQVKGRPCWHRVAVAPLKLPLLTRYQAGAEINVAELGTVLQSGWGTPPDTLN